MRKKSGNGEDDLANQIIKAILDFLSQVPSTEENATGDPHGRARQIAHAAAVKAAMVSGALALPPGPLGWLTILPDLIAVWRIQAQMVADIAAVYGKKASLGPEQMLYCLFRHAAAQAVRDLVVRVGERYLVRRVSVRTFQAIVRKVGVRITQRVLGRGISRLLPVVGAVGVGAYAYLDTIHVAKTSIELFSRDIDIAPEPAEPVGP